MFRKVAVFNFALVAALLGGALFGDRGVIRHEKLEAQLARLDALNQNLRAENARLGREASALRSDPAYVALVVRDELGWVRKDEIVFIAQPEPSLQAAVVDELSR